MPESPLPRCVEPPFRIAGFPTLAAALDYAAEGDAGLCFYAASGTLTEALPYRTLRAQAIGLARRMLGAGLRPGDRVGLIAESDGDFVRAFFACQYAALVPVPLPLPTAFGGRERCIEHLGRMLRRARVSAAFGPAILDPWLREALHVAGLGPLLAGTLATLDHAAATAAPLPAQDPDGLGYLQFSSGSTRFPLGVAVTQRAFMANARGIGRDGLRVQPSDRAVTWLPFYHDMGLVGFLLTPITCQISVDVLATRDFVRRPLLWLELISRNRATISYSPSFGYDLCLRRATAIATDSLDLSSWRSAGIGGDMIRPEVLSRFAARFARNGFRAEAFVPSYGMAEATLALSLTAPGEGARCDVVDRAILETEQRAVPAAAGPSRSFVICGRMLPGHEVEIRDEGGAVLGARQVGRIVVRGPSLMAGYFDAAEETERVLSADGWLDTGDLGYLVDGQIVVTGRSKDLIIVNGRNLWPQDLEWTIEAELAAVRSGDAVVFSVDDGAGEEVVALVECRASAPEARRALEQETGNLLRGRYGIAVRVVLVPPRSLPQTSSGKLSRSRARAMYLAGEFAPRASAAPPLAATAVG
ncbi:MAG: fatty acyl-AMP ligase [Acetobacteraceae bacterium]